MFSALAGPPVYSAVYQQHHLLAAVAFSGRRPLPPGYLAAAVGVPAAPLNPCLADHQRLAAVLLFLEAVEVGLLETKIFAQFSYENEQNLEKNFLRKRKYLFLKKS
jgi:hypothetical protein